MKAGEKHSNSLFPSQAALHHLVEYHFFMIPDVIPGFLQKSSKKPRIIKKKEIYLCSPADHKHLRRFAIKHFISFEWQHIKIARMIWRVHVKTNFVCLVLRLGRL